MFYKGVLKNFTKFTGKHLCQSLMLSKVRGLMPVNLLEKRLYRKCFLVNFKSSLRTPRCSRPEVLLGKGVLKNMQQIYRRTPVLKCDFSKVGKQLGTRWEAASDHLRRIMKCIKSKPRLRERPLQQMIHVSKFWEQNYKTSQLLLL